MGGNFPGGNFPRTVLQTSQLALTCSKSTMEAAVHCVKSPLNKLTPAGYQRISLRYYVTTIAVEKQWDVLQSSYSKKLCKIFRGIQRCILSYLNTQSNIYDGAFLRKQLTAEAVKVADVVNIILAFMKGLFYNFITLIKSCKI